MLTISQRNMNSDQLQAFVKIVQAGSFSRAAELMNTQKSHLSRVLTQLEGELGVKLIERTTRALHVTEVGREVFERAVGILGAMDDVQRVTQNTQGQPRGILRLTCGVEFGQMAVGGWVDEYLASHPQVAVEMEYTSRLLDLVHEGFDLAIRIGTLDESRLAARLLGQLEYGLFAAPGYLKRRGMPHHPDDLKQHELLLFSVGSQRSGWRLQGPDSQTVKVDSATRLRVNNNLAVCEAAAQGLGVAQLSLLVAAGPVARGELVPVLPDWAAAPVPAHAVFPSNRYLTPKVRAFIDLAAARFPAHAQACRLACRVAAQATGPAN